MTVELTVDVRDHGALGDGVTDDIAAIQAALNAAALLSHEHDGVPVWVLLPAGRYMVTAP